MDRSCALDVLSDSYSYNAVTILADNSERLFFMLECESLSFH